MSFLCALSNVIGAGVEDVAAEVADGGGEVGAALRNHVEVALPLGLDYLKYIHVEPQQQIHVGHDADAEAAGDEAGDDLVLGRLIRNFRLRADALEELVLDGAHTGARGEEHMRIGQRVGEVDAVARRERVAARACVFSLGEGPASLPLRLEALLTRQPFRQSENAPMAAASSSIITSHRRVNLASQFCLPPAFAGGWLLIIFLTKLSQYVGRK